MVFKLSANQIPRHIQHELLDAHGCEPWRQVQQGLSGAAIWECKNSTNASTCLRCWPAGHPTQKKLSEIHRHMQCLTNASVSITPAVYYSRSGSSIASDGQRLWELTTWLPGQADYLSCPNQDKLRSAMQAIARIHHIWSSTGRAKPDFQLQVGSPTLFDRIQRLTLWQDRLSERTRAMENCSDPIERQLVSDTFELLKTWSWRLKRELQVFAERRIECHFVLRDVWSDHVLFTGEQVTGIIDFGAARHDEPTTDLVRLLGSLEPLNVDRRREGLDAYNEFRQATCGKSTGQASGFEALCWERLQAMDRTATLLSAAQWMEWLIVEQRRFEQPRAQLLERWRSFVNRMVSFEGQ